MTRRTIGRIVPLLLVLAGRAGAGYPVQATFPASPSAQLRVIFGAGGREVLLPGQVTFVLDAAAAGLFLQAEAQIGLNTEPPGLSLPLAPPNPLLTLHYDPALRLLRVVLAQEELTTLGLDPGDRVLPLPFLLRHREQFALYSISMQGGPATLVSLCRARYQLRLQLQRDYQLCSQLAIHLGERELSLAELQEGIGVEALDELADVVVAGTDPPGQPFVHTYQLDHRQLAKRVNDACEAAMKRLREFWRQP